MIFKNSNFIHLSKYNQYLIDNKIKKRLILLGVTQCNGCIKRFHLIIDKKCSTLLSKAETFNQVEQIINDFSYEYNFRRYHYYSELETISNLKYNERYLTPYNAINQLYNYMHNAYV